MQKVWWLWAATLKSSDCWRLIGRAYFRGQSTRSPGGRRIHEALSNWTVFHVPESLAKVIRKRTFEVTIDRAFREVMQACAAPGPKRDSTWITGEFVEAYTQMHRQPEGHAHSVECWRNGELAGGIYGVSVGGLFAGEYMFHRTNNASKVALNFLVGHLRQRGFWLFDIQMVTAATRALGAKAISRSEYLKRLAVAVTKDCSFS